MVFRTLSQLLILQDIERRKLLGVHALQAQDLDRRPGKAALRLLRGALHEKHNGGRSYCLVDDLACLV